MVGLVVQPGGQAVAPWVGEITIAHPTGRRGPLKGWWSMSETPLGSDLLQALQDCLRALRKPIYLGGNLAIEIYHGPRPWHPLAVDKYVGTVGEAASQLWQATNWLKTLYQDAVQRRLIESVGLVSACGVTGADAYEAG